ncbi:MAG: PKD domain-containing protein [Lentisphaerae bacterium]|nr:PKD domain-containing protein [Lentisphaerota bacterium]
MSHPTTWRTIAATLLCASLSIHVGASTNWALIAWNDLGMHCMDGRDFSVFSILPPYNNVHAQLVHDGKRMDGESYVSMTYEAIADPSGSINRTSIDKVNFWTFVHDFFGANPPPDQGLAGTWMPGVSNLPQPMAYDSTRHWYVGEGIPITPYDDAGHKNYYPMFRLRAFSNGTELAHADVVLPVSDEMDCRACHQSGSDGNAMPSAGWVWDVNPDKAYKLNILRLHDENNTGDPTYDAALTNAGYRADGLYLTVRIDGKPILCARCHASNALPGTGLPNIPPLTAAIHDRHAKVLDPESGVPLQDASQRSACYRCHPGSTTRCLRGAMGSAVASDGSMAMQCQDCHGSMKAVGDAARMGWLEQPNCQACHTGSATHNNGALRYTSAFDTNGQLRLPVDTLFATTPDTPIPGTSLYRFSTGHGGLQCEACHGSTHAEYPSSHASDNIQSRALQGHAGTLIECATCHSPVPTASAGGPHGMHPLGRPWVKTTGGPDHRSAADADLNACRRCHGQDLRGTALSRVHGYRTINTGDYGTKAWWPGYQVGCYTCHSGPSSEDSQADHAPSVATLSATTPANTPTNLWLMATDADADPLALRVVSQPLHGTVALVSNVATYVPDQDFIGSDAFSFAAWDGTLDSNLASGLVTVVSGACEIEGQAYAPPAGFVDAPVPFWGSAVMHACNLALTWKWTFGDGSPFDTNAITSHTYAAPGTYDWQVTVRAGPIARTLTGRVAIDFGVIDEDSDTISDPWEVAYFGRLGVVSNGTDVDGDQFVDAAESLAGTDPTNDQSYLGLTSVTTVPAGQVVLTWSSATNRHYSVVASTNLQSIAEFTPVASNLPATPPVNIVTNVTIGNVQYFRIRLE